MDNFNNKNYYYFIIIVDIHVCFCRQKIVWGKIVWQVFLKKVDKISNNNVYFILIILKIFRNLKKLKICKIKNFSSFHEKLL